MTVAISEKDLRTLIAGIGNGRSPSLKELEGLFTRLDDAEAAKRELVEVVGEGLAFTAAYSGIQRGVGGPMDNALAADSADATTRKMQALLAKHKETTDA